MKPIKALASHEKVVGFFVVLIWIVIGIVMTIFVDRKNKEEMENWSEEKWNRYYELNEYRSFRGE